MPEKPEVITVVNSLKPRIIGKKVKEVEVYWDNIIAYPSVDEFKKKLKNQTIKKLSTRGKWIVVELSKDTLLIHLRMEGKFFFRHYKDLKNKHEHVFFRFTDNEEMRFADVRKFGKMYLIPTNEIDNRPPLSELGFEYNDKLLTKEYLVQKFSKKNLPIKTVLLDQSIITGIGNIYDDEILFMSKINPLRKAKDITPRECGLIIKNTSIVLNKAIKLGGTTIKNFTSSEGVHGLFQNELLVHGKKNANCPLCGTKLENIKIGGRGTYYCPKCQKK